MNAQGRSRLGSGTTMKALLAFPRGFCAGVERAIDICDLALEMYGPPVYVRRELVHNPHVITSFREKGVIFVDSLGEVPNNSVVIYSAHGVSPAVRDEARRKHLTAIDATCPLVTKVHLEALKYAKEGYSIILIGHEGHDEVIGTIGHAPDRIHLIDSVAEVEQLKVPTPDKVVALNQTTLSVDDTREVVEALKRRFPNLVVRNDICYATQNRQTAVKEIARKVDMVLVVGAHNSSNSNRLREVAEVQGHRAYLVNDAGEINPAWLEGAKTVGVTSGASTPDVLVQGVLDYLRKRGGLEVKEAHVLDENVQFTLPKELREFAVKVRK
ncbi:MAG: 4-hydroxy-3-methylbut-2-enyl diphosphate reductase [Chloroflexi bacterium]|nr:4-hydroxy-3-methylbut-2-enyl diphosphate reductase [Chloroflexota bacterium]